MSDLQLKMLRFYLRFALLPIILLTAVLLVIRSQPYDDHELRELLLPTDCPAPCFMGIRPGVKMDEAIAILEASEWVNKISRMADGAGGTVVDWFWNDQKLKIETPGSFGELYAPEYAEEPIVDIISTYQSIRLGDVIMLMGNGDLQFMYGAYGSVSYFIYYETLGLSLQVYLDCDVTEPYKSVVNLRLGDRFDSPGVEPIDALGDVLRAC